MNLEREKEEQQENEKKGTPLSQEVFFLMKWS